MPESLVVIGLGIFTQWGTTIARAYYPYIQTATVYGVIEFNTNYLSKFSENEIVGTIIHEIFYSLGMGWYV